MDRLVYTALSSLRGHMSAQASIANNLANASTIGFKADRVEFEKSALVGGVFETRQLSSEQILDIERQAGTMLATGRKLDVAVNGDAWLAVQAADGEENYTRRGDLTVSDTGVLQTGDGFPVLGSSGSPITVPPNEGISIGPDGSVLIVPAGGTADQPQVLDRLKLVSPLGSETTKGLDNLLKVKGGGTLPEDLNATVSPGSLEQSNVNMTAMLVDMIENQRSYEVQSKLLATTKDMDESGASLMRLPG